MRTAVQGCEIGRVLVTVPDRLAHNRVHQMILVEESAQAGYTAKFLDCPMSDERHDPLMRRIRGGAAEHERTSTAERMRRGRLTKLRAGQLLP
ncbi:recombinase family protein [Microvirga arabica]|nr:recombinase family protein [Microvirga arabica]